MLLFNKNLRLKSSVSSVCINAYAQCWYDKRGYAHRGNDMPAIIKADGNRYWYKHGQLHRDGNKPAVIYACGKQYRFINGVHQEDVPFIATIFIWFMIVVILSLVLLIIYGLLLYASN